MSPDPLLALGRVLTRLGPKALASHTTAAALHAFDLLEPPDCIQITVPRTCTAPHVEGVRVWRSDVRAADVGLADSGLPVTSPARTAADLALTLPLDQAVLAIDSALRSGRCSVAQIRSRYRARPGARHAGEVLALADPRAGSRIESCLRVRLHEAGIPPPETQFPILDTAGELILVADFAWPALRLVVETDGHAYHSGRRRLLVDRYRANALLRAGWHLMRFGYEDVVGRGRHCARLVLMTMRTLASGELWVPLARPGVDGPLPGPGRSRPERTA